MSPSARAKLCKLRSRTLIRTLAALVMATSPANAQNTAPSQPQVAPLQDLNKYPGLAPELGRLLAQLHEQVRLPQPRSQSRLLPLLPDSTIAYAAIPNYGDAAHQALMAFRNELQTSAVLRNWWEHGDMATSGPQIEAAIEQFHQLAEYLGDEVVISATLESGGKPRPLLVAEVRKSGLKDFLLEVSRQIPSEKKPSLRILDSNGLATAYERVGGEDFTVLVRSDFVAAALDLGTLREFNARVDLGKGKFGSTPFGQRVAQSYADTASMIAAVDLQQILKQMPKETGKNQLAFARTGFDDAKYLVWKHNGVRGQATSQMELSFNGPRYGVASWLAAPAALGSLSFISAEAIFAGAVLLKDPAQIFDDIRNLASQSNPKTFAGIDQMERGLKLSLRDDVLGPLAGEIAYEIDIPNEERPDWKLILGLKDPEHLQKTLNALLATAPVNARQFEDDGVLYHSLQIPSQQKPTKIEYAFVQGYLIIASGREVLAQAVRLHRNGRSLASSKKFLAALPPGRSSEVSGLFYQAPIAMAAMNLRRISPEWAETFAHPGAESEPSVICVYGEDAAIREESRSGNADVGAILVGAAIAIPNLLRARIAANESSAVASIRTINTAQVTYSAMYPNHGFARDLAALRPDPGGTTQSADHSGLIDASLANPSCTAGNWCTKSGFRFTVVSACRTHRCSEYVVVGTPLNSNTGTRNFCSTSEAVIRFNNGPPLTSSMRPSECRSWQPFQ